MANTAMELGEILARWDNGEGKPYKGSLIDWSAYDGDGFEPPADIGCMCAQGQVLHLFGGWTPKRLSSTNQSSADESTAKLLNISRAHAVLLRNINDSVDGAPSVVLTDPGKVLGDQWSKLLDFWWAFDQFNADDWRKVVAAWVAARVAARDAAGVAARDAARDAAGVAAGFAAGDAAGFAAWFAAGFAARVAARVAAGVAARVAARVAAWEIQGFGVLTERGRDVFFLPMFGWASPANIPARPAGYGLGSVPA